MHEAGFPANAIDATHPEGAGRGPYRAAVAAFGILCLVIWLVATSNLPASNPRVWLGSGIVLVCGVPLIVFAARPDRWYPLLPVIALAYLIGNGVPAFHDVFPILNYVDPLTELDYLFACKMACL